jgi:UDP-2,4-diacetamido-2,4,6-trideoxy-beta-L-altropyranose hydrolase
MGAGHVMRCLTLANALRERGAHCRFICREEPGNLLDMIDRQGFETFALPVANDQDIDWQADAEQTKVGAGDMAIDWLVVDHYALDARWESAMRPSCCRIMVIDDLADRLHDADLLLDQNLGRHSEHYAGLVPQTCRPLFGPEFALLRQEFSRWRPYSLARRLTPRINRVLVSMGGVDNDNVTSRVLALLNECSLEQECTIKVMMGPRAPWIGEVKGIASALRWNTEVIVSPPDVAKILADADLAIGASGSSSWERCCLGLPTVSVVIADNQEYIGRQLANIGAIRLVHLESLDFDLKASFDDLIESPSRLEQMSQMAASITNGTGVDSVVDAMSPFK